jgi:hypothetical protein
MGTGAFTVTGYAAVSRSVVCAVFGAVAARGAFIAARLPAAVRARRVADVAAEEAAVVCAGACASADSGERFAACMDDKNGFSDSVGVLQA